MVLQPCLGCNAPCLPGSRYCHTHARGLIPTTSTHLSQYRRFRDIAQRSPDTLWVYDCEFTQAKDDCEFTQAKGACAIAWAVGIRRYSDGKLLFQCRMDYGGMSVEELIDEYHRLFPELRMANLRRRSVQSPCLRPSLTSVCSMQLTSNRMRDIRPPLPTLTFKQIRDKLLEIGFDETTHALFSYNQMAGEDEPWVLARWKITRRTKGGIPAWSR